MKERIFAGRILNKMKETFTVEDFRKEMIKPDANSQPTRNANSFRYSKLREKFTVLEGADRKQELYKQIDAVVPIELQSYSHEIRPGEISGAA